MNKAEARRSAKSIRAEAHKVSKEAASQLRDNFHSLLDHLRFLPVDHSLALYHSFGSEISTQSLSQALRQTRLTLCLPCVVAPDSPLVFRKWDEEDELIDGAYGIMEPPQDKPILEPDVVCVPMLAFDDEGYRLGYGGGFYDRTLSALRAKRHTVAIGLAYRAQRMDRVPRDAYDEPLDYVVTEESVLQMPIARKGNAE